MQKISVSITLDTRWKAKNKKAVVKLQISQPEPRIQKLYQTNFRLTVEEFKSAWKERRPRDEFKDLRRKLEAVESNALKIVNSLDPFSFEAFEKNFFNKENKDFKNAFIIFDELEKQKLEKGAISTAEKYRSAKVSIQNYLRFKNQNSDSLTFDKITVQFLESFQSYCENVRKNSAATIGIHLRNLRAVYNLAIKKGVANQDKYPFLNEHFIIPSSKKVNKALTESQLKQLWEGVPQTPGQARSKDFWFFSFYSFGMNTKDICELKHSALDSDALLYVRAKTRTTKKERTTKNVPLGNRLLEIIERQKTNDSIFLFGILDEEDAPLQKHNKIKNFNKVINHHFREYAKAMGIDSNFAIKLGTYHARHSFTTLSIRRGKSFALISEVLHDGNLKVTQSYINSFPKEDLKELSNDLEF